jgi:hypothetical protein
MMEAKLWRGRKRKPEQVHARTRCGELVQWDTSDHDWLEGRGERVYLVWMIDDATNRLYARFVTSDSTAENMRVLGGYLKQQGRPLAFYADKAALFQAAQKPSRDEPGVEKDPADLPPTQIGPALRELGIVWIAAHSPQAKGRVERRFSTAQYRLVKGLQVAGVSSLEQANAYLEQEFLPWWNRRLTVAPSNECDAHRPLIQEYDLAAILRHVEERQISNGTRYSTARAELSNSAEPSANWHARRQVGAWSGGWMERLPCASTASACRWRFANRSPGSIRKRLPKRALLAHARVAGCKASLSGLALGRPHQNDR